MSDAARVIATAVLAIQAVVYYTGSGKEANPHIAPWSQFPSAVNGWNAVEDRPMDPEFVHALRPDDYLIRTYASSGRAEAVNLFVGYFNSRRDNRAPHSPEWCLPGAGWRSVSSRAMRIRLPGGQALPANEYIIEKGSARALVLYWYHQGRRATASEVTAQLYSLPDLILHGRTDTALVRIIVPISGDDLASARSAATSFAAEAYPLIRKQIS